MQRYGWSFLRNKWRSAVFPPKSAGNVAYVLKKTSLSFDNLVRWSILKFFSQEESNISANFWDEISNDFIYFQKSDTKF